jgi:hypothetical protein
MVYTLPNIAHNLQLQQASHNPTAHAWTQHVLKTHTKLAVQAY